MPVFKGLAVDHKIFFDNHLNADSFNQYKGKSKLIFSIHEAKSEGEGRMDKKDLKRLLASVGIAGLIGMGGISVPGAHAGSG